MLVVILSPKAQFTPDSSGPEAPYFIRPVHDASRERRNDNKIASKFSVSPLIDLYARVFSLLFIFSRLRDATRFFTS